MKTLKDIGELRLIEMFGKKYKTAKHTIMGIGDDAAVIQSPKKGEFILFTCDTIVEDVHFIINPVRGRLSKGMATTALGRSTSNGVKKSTGYQVGWKAMGAGISDIAAMGGEPKNAVISLAIPPYIGMNYVNELIKGINAAGGLFGVDIVGGDTVSSPKGLVITVSLIGTVFKNKLVLRSGARRGDKILVTGTLGGSMLKKQFNFIPRVKEASWLVNNGRINSMMDITDGLSLDLHRLITASKVGARIYEDLIPISKDALKSKNPLGSALNDGEDFELIFTSPDSEKFLEKWPYKNVQLTVIGGITKNTGKIEFISRDGRKKTVIPKGYEHFK